MTTRSAKCRPTAVCDGSGGFVNAFGCELLGVTTMRELELRVEDHQITVNMIDTKLSITYQLSPEGHLEEIRFGLWMAAAQSFVREHGKQLIPRLANLHGYLV